MGRNKGVESCTYTCIWPFHPAYILTAWLLSYRTDYQTSVTITKLGRLMWITYIIPLFVNTSQHGPVWHQQSNWNKVCAIIKGKWTPLPPPPPPPKDINPVIFRICSKILFIFEELGWDCYWKGYTLIRDFEQMLGGSEKIEFKDSVRELWLSSFE